MKAIKKIGCLAGVFKFW